MKLGVGHLNWVIVDATVDSHDPQDQGRPRLRREWLRQAKTWPGKGKRDQDSGLRIL